MKTTLRLAAFCLAILLMSHLASAATITVTTLSAGGPGSLADAVTAAEAGDTVTFSTNLAGTITLTNQLTINSNLTIVGPGSKILAVSGNNNSRVFEIYTGVTANISGLTVTGGLDLGADGTAGNRDGANGVGGGIYNSGYLTLTACTIAQNSAIGGRGFADVSSNPLGEGGVAEGGGIFSDGNSLTLVNCQVTSNYVFGGDGEVTTDGGANYGLGGAAGGAGIFSISPVCSITNCTLSFNSATGGNAAGGGDADGYGGGISILQGILVNCTIASNLAVGGNAVTDTNLGGSAFGGGVDASDYASTGVRLLSCTISGNAAAGGAGGSSGGGAQGGGIFTLLVQNPPPLTLENTIVSGNNVFGGSGGGSSLGPDVNGTVISGGGGVGGNPGGFNFIGETDGSYGWVTSGVGQDQTGTVGQPMNPLLGPLQFNGGLTPTMALIPGSKAIDAGNCFNVHFDQRSQTRPVHYYAADTLGRGLDGTDIGAFELSPPLLTLEVHLPYVLIVWIENGQTPYGTVPGTAPIFGLQTLTGSLSDGASAWGNFNGFVRGLNNGQFMGKDVVDPTKVGLVGYGLNSSTTTQFFILPLTTLPASAVTPYTAQFGGSNTPAGPNSMYHFVWGYDTNYTLGSTPTNPQTTSILPVEEYATVGGLNPLTTYHYQYVVKDDDAATQVGGDQSFTTPGLPPVVTTTGATGVGATSATLNGTINAENPNSSVAAYFQYDVGSGGTNYSFDTRNNQYLGAPSGGAQGFSFTLTNLSPGTQYHWRAVGFNSTSEGVGADTNFTTAPLPLPPTLNSPGVSSPAGPYVSSLTPTFTWSPNGSLTNSFGLYIAQYPSGASPQSVTNLYGNSAAPVTLAPGTNYSWYMTSSDSFGDQSGPSQTNYFKTPTSPTAFTDGASNIVGGVEVLFGYVYPNGLATSVYFQYGATTNYGGNVPLSPVNIGTNSQAYSYTNNFVGGTYHFRFVATNSLGTGYGTDLQFQTSGE